MKTPESAARWLRVVVLVLWAGVLLGLLWSIAFAVRVSQGEPGFVVLPLVSATCGWLYVVLRLFPGWRSSGHPDPDIPPAPSDGADDQPPETHVRPRVVDSRMTQAQRE